MKNFKQYIKYSIFSIIILGILWILLAPKIPCVPYHKDKELALLLIQAKQKDFEALNNLTGFLSLRGDKKNALLGQCALCQSGKGPERYCNSLLEKVECSDNALEKITIKKNTWLDIKQKWCKITHIF